MKNSWRATKRSAVHKSESPAAREGSLLEDIKPRNRTWSIAKPSTSPASTAATLFTWSGSDQRHLRAAPDIVRGGFALQVGLAFFHGGKAVYRCDRKVLDGQLPDVELGTDGTDGAGESAAQVHGVAHRIAVGRVARERHRRVAIRNHDAARRLDSVQGDVRLSARQVQHAHQRGDQHISFGQRLDANPLHELTPPFRWASDHLTTSRASAAVGSMTGTPAAAASSTTGISVQPSTMA